jgi:hypothetical protein
MAVNQQGSIPVGRNYDAIRGIVDLAGHIQWPDLISREKI